MVDIQMIQSAMAEIRRGKKRKKDRKKKLQDENILFASAFCCRFTQVVLEKMSLNGLLYVSQSALDSTAKLRTEGLQWRKVLLPACHCHWQLEHSDYKMPEISLTVLPTPSLYQKV